MGYVIGPDCIEVLDRACIEACPVDCIYVGDRKSYINVTECIDCGACEPERPVTAIFSDRTAAKDEERRVHLNDQEDFFETTLPGREAPLHNPGGATALGDVGVDTPLVSGAIVA